MFIRAFSNVLKNYSRLCCHQNVSNYLLLKHHRTFPRFISSFPYLNIVHRQASTIQTKEHSSKDLSKIFNQVKLDSENDLALKKVFAVVHIAGKQFKVANNDIIMTNNKIEAKCGDVIRLEKVLAVGGRTFTLVGKPLLKRELVNVEAMVMEKTKGEKKIAFKKKRRKGYKRWKGHRQDLSVLKIKSIDFDSSVL